MMNNPHRFRIIVTTDNPLNSRELYFDSIVNAAEKLKRLLHDWDSGNETFEAIFPATQEIGLYMVNSHDTELSANLIPLEVH